MTLTATPHLVPPLADIRAGEQVFRILYGRSPLISATHDRVYVTPRFWSHLKDKEGAEFPRRACRMSWLELTLVQPAEVWQDRTHPDGQVYLARFSHQVGGQTRTEVHVVCVNNTELVERLSVATMFALRRPGDVAKFRGTLRMLP